MYRVKIIITKFSNSILFSSDLLAELRVVTFPFFVEILSPEMGNITTSCQVKYLSYFQLLKLMYQIYSVIR